MAVRKVSSFIAVGRKSLCDMSFCILRWGKSPTDRCVSFCVIGVWLPRPYVGPLSMIMCFKPDVLWTDAESCSYGMFLVLVLHKMLNLCVKFVC